MALREAHDPKVLAHYEGLVYVAARQLVERGVEMELEDIQQVLRLKTFRSLLTFKAERIQRSGEAREKARDRYVRMVLIDQGKDLLKRPRRRVLHIEDLVKIRRATQREAASRDWFDEKYLSEDHDDVFGEVEADELLLPSTLTQLERRIVTLLVGDFKQSEAGRQLGLDKREIEKLMRSIRLKMADWSPGGAVEDEDELDEHRRPPWALAAA
jgi:hypothetical protein